MIFIQGNQVENTSREAWVILTVNIMFLSLIENSTQPVLVAIDRHVETVGDLA